jgi:hypothetical protein
MRAVSALVVTSFLAVPAWAQELELSPFENATGVELMQAVRDQHQLYPHTYEEQSLVLTDRHGQRETRRMRTYMRAEEDGTLRYMLLFDTPVEVEGVALIAERLPDGTTNKYFYLPAFGQQLVEAGGTSYGENFLGTDFAVEDLTGEVLEDYRYERQRDERIDGTRHFVVDAFPAGDDDAPVAMRHFIDGERMFVVRTDHLDYFGRLRKRQTFHDLRQVGAGAWRANIMHMDDLRTRHQSLIRVDRRIFSRDYVPPEVFSAEWLFANHRPMVAEMTEDEQP